MLQDAYKNAPKSLEQPEKKKIFHIDILPKTRIKK